MNEISIKNKIFILISKEGIKNNLRNYQIINIFKIFYNVYVGYLFDFVRNYVLEGRKIG